MGDTLAQPAKSADLHRRVRLLHDVQRLGRASLIDLKREGHSPRTIKACVDRGLLEPIRWHGPEAYHWELTDAGKAATFVLSPAELIAT